MKQKEKATLLVRAPRTPAGEYRWLLTGRDGRREEGVITTAESLPQREPSCRTLLLLPASLCVLWQEPSGGRKPRPSATVLLWQREEHLLVDAEQLHAGDVLRTGAEAWLAAVDTRQLRAWLEALARWRLTPDAIFPDVAMLPVGGSVCLDGEWLLRSGETDARAIPVAALTEWPEADIAAALRAQACGDRQSLQCFSGPVPPGRGLLTGSFRPRMQLRALRGKRLLGAVLGLWLVSLALLPSAQRWHLSRQNQAEQAQLRLLALQAFPELSDGESLVPWLKTRLDSTSHSTGGLSDFLQRNQDFLQQPGQGSIHGLRWEAQSRRLTFNLNNPPEMLPALAAEYSNPARTIVLTQVKGRKMVNVSIQEQEQ